MMHWCVIIIASLLIITCGRVIELHTQHTELDNNVTKSLLTTAEFENALPLSLNKSQCINVIINGTSETTTTYFENFVRIYPNTYFVGQNILKCTGYLMISTTETGVIGAMQFVPVKVSTIEMLIIVDQYINASSELLNTKIYGNANVRIMSPNGLWCISENYLTPRVFKKVYSVKEFKYDTGIANLGGRKLGAIAFNDPPYVYMYVDKTVNGVKAEFSPDSKSPKLDGVSLKLFIMMVERLNATYVTRVYDTDDKTFRPLKIMKLIGTNELDIVLTKLQSVSMNSFTLNLTIPFGQSLAHFLVPKPKLRTSFWGPITPLTPIVWISVIIMLITQSLFVYTKARLFPTRLSRKFESFAMTWIELMGRLLNTTAPKIIPGFKITFQLWSVASILLLTAYSSNLASSLTFPGYEKRIDTLEDFIEANLTWGSNKTRQAFDSYFNTTDRYSNETYSRFVSETGEESEKHKKIMKGNYAIFGKLIGNNFFLDRFVSSTDLKGYRLMKEPISTITLSFSVQPWLLNSANKVIMLLLECGFVDYHVRHVIHRCADPALSEVLKEHEDQYDEPRVLSLKPLAISFGFLILGLLVSTIVFIFEILSFTGPQKSFMQVLMDIKKSREISNFRKGKTNYVCRRLTYKKENVSCIFAIKRKSKLIFL